ncbi:uncharacterized protein LOC114047885 [Vombatus ursinus]|uniref:uncharacterized protein LOC114047885 n=1 Tax=Vombatus ursinus TaxID=29139 RepID=UPI000FFDACF1|nr:uncharacterized protein LOC114047885 [Vombatus ursinus]
MALLLPGFRPPRAGGRRRRRSSPAPGLGRSLGRRRGLAQGAQRAPSRPGRRRRRGPRPPCPSSGPGRPPPPHGSGRLELPGGRPAAGASPRTAPGSAHPPRCPPLPAPRAAAERRGGRPGLREESERKRGLRHPGRSVKATTTGAVLLLPTCRGGHWACANADHIRQASSVSPPPASISGIRSTLQRAGACWSDCSLELNAAQGFRPEVGRASLMNGSGGGAEREDD